MTNCRTSPTPIRLLCWNVQAASAKRARRQADWILSQAPDVVVLTEVPPRGNAHVAALAAVGYGTVCAPGGTDRRTLIAVRADVPVEVVPDVTPADWLHRAPAVRVRVGGGELFVLGLYVPSRGPAHTRNESKRAMQTAVSKVLPEVAGLGANVVVLGDLNVVEPSHQPHMSVFGKWEYDFYRSFEVHGFRDAYREVHPNAAEYSWFGHSGAGYRFDHAFVGAGPSVLDCSYDQTPRVDQLSDHAALCLTLTLDEVNPDTCVRSRVPLSERQGDWS